MIVLLAGCAKSRTCSPLPPSAEIPQILAYASANGMNVNALPSGLYYEILNPGSGIDVTDNSRISITYVGKTLDGVEFDRQQTPNNPGWVLSGLIEGWRLGIPLIKKGGHIRLLIPSSLAYGCEPYKTLPGNAILFFDILLVDVQ
jgi:FKBP-type peptidyl-prolyl cis-trans isomerase FkpA